MRWHTETATLAQRIVRAKKKIRDAGIPYEVPEARELPERLPGVLQMVECWGDDVPQGKQTSFPMAVKCREDETVVFSWLVWPSREVRDQAMPRIMEDPRLQPDVNPMPFDGQRLIYGGGRRGGRSMTE